MSLAVGVARCVDVGVGVLAGGRCGDCRQVSNRMTINNKSATTARTMSNRSPATVSFRRFTDSQKGFAGGKGDEV